MGGGVKMLKPLIPNAPVVVACRSAVPMLYRVYGQRNSVPRRKPPAKIRPIPRAGKQKSQKSFSGGLVAART